MATVSVYATSQVNTGWTNGNNLIGDTTDTFAFDGLPQAPPDDIDFVFRSESDSGSFYSQSLLNIPGTEAKAFITKAPGVAPTIAVAKAQGLELLASNGIANDDSNSTGGISIVFSSAAFAAIPDSATFASVELEVSHEASDFKIYRARVNWTVPDSRGRRFTHKMMVPSPIVRR